VLEPETRHAPARMDHLWDAAADRFEQG